MIKYEESVEQLQETPFKRRINSPSIYIESSAKSKCIFKRQHPMSTRMGKLKDFEDQLEYSFKKTQVQQISFEKFNHLLKKDTLNESVVSVLNTLQEQLVDVDKNIEEMEIQFNGKGNYTKGQYKISELEYFQQNVECIITRLRNILSSQNLLQDQQNPLNFTFNNNLNKFVKVYKCKFCHMKFGKACSLGGHISRTHKIESYSLKKDQPKKKRKLI